MIPSSTTPRTEPATRSRSALVRALVGSRLGVRVLAGMALLLFGIIALVIGRFDRQTYFSSEAKRGTERHAARVAIDQAGAAKLSELGWVDAAKGTVRLPIERAMELTAKELAAKPIAATATVAGGPPASTSVAAVTTVPAAAPATTTTVPAKAVVAPMAATVPATNSISGPAPVTPGAAPVPPSEASPARSASQSSAARKATSPSVRSSVRGLRGGNTR